MGGGNGLLSVVPNLLIETYLTIQTIISNACACQVPSNDFYDFLAALGFRISYKEFIPVLSSFGPRKENRSFSTLSLK